MKFTISRAYFLYILPIDNISKYISLMNISCASMISLRVIFSAYFKMSAAGKE